MQKNICQNERGTKKKKNTAERKKGRKKGQCYNWRQWSESHILVVLQKDKSSYYGMALPSETVSSLHL